METLDRRRRRGSAGGDPSEAGSAHPSLESETALSHGPVSYAPDHMPAPSGSRTGNILNGPWTSRGVPMESGLVARQAGALAGPIASPFHSEKVQNEVQLQRFRPATLDEDGRRTGAFFEGRPSLESGNTERKEGPRVARVEAHEEGPEKGTLEETFVGDPQAPGPSGAGPQGALGLN